MSDPLGKEVDRVSVRVLPNVKRFLPDLQKYLKRIEASVRVEIPTSLDTAGLEAEARRAAELIERSVSVDIPVDADTAAAEVKLDEVARTRTAQIKVDVDRKSLALVTSALSGALSAIRTLSVGGSKGASLAILGSGGIAGLAQLTAVVAQTAGALALLPAAALAASAAIGTLVLAFVGIKDSAAPAVVDLRAAIDELTPAWVSLQEVVRQRLFAGLDDELRELAATFLPVLREQLGGIADSLNDIAFAFSDAFQTPDNVANTNQGLSNTAEALGVIATAIGPFVDAMADIAAVGSTFLEPLAKGLAGAADTFADFIEEARRSGDLKEFMQGGIDAIGQLFSLLGDVVGIFSGIGSAAIASLGGLAGGLGGILDELNTFLNSKAGQKALTGFFDGIGEGLGALGDALAGPVGKALVKILPALGDILGDIGERGVGVIVLIARVLKPLAGPLAKISELATDTFVAIAEAITPGLVTLAGSLATSLLDLFTQITPLLPSFVAALGDLFTALGGTLAEVLPELVPALVGLIEAIFPLLPQIVDALVPVIEALAPILVDLLQNVPPVIEVLTPFIELIGDLIGPATLLVQLFGGLLNLLSDGFLFTLLPIIKPWSDLLEEHVNPALKLLKDNLDFIKELITAGFADAIGDLIGFFADLNKKVVNLVNNLADFLDLLSQLPSTEDLGKGGFGFLDGLPGIDMDVNPSSSSDKASGGTTVNNIVAHDYDDFVRQSSDRQRRGSVGGVVFA